MSTPVYRIDAFAVPEAARGLFRDNAARTIPLLRRQPGYVRDMWFEQITGPGRFNLVTLVEWADEARMAAAAEAVAALHREINFDKRGFLTAHGIDASMAAYVAKDV